MDKYTEAALFWFCVIGAVAGVAYLAGIVVELIIALAGVIVDVCLS